MTRELLVLRHAKSDWGVPGARDFDRVLAKRGWREAPAVGEWLAAEGLVPDAVVCSPAVRARQTLEALRERLELPDPAVSFDRRIYEASPEALLRVLAEAPLTAQRVLLVGHNPGVDELVAHLCPEPLPRTPAGKLMTTAALARIEMPDDWSQLGRGCGRLVVLRRP